MRQEVILWQEGIQKLLSVRYENGEDYIFYGFYNDIEKEPYDKIYVDKVCKIKAGKECKIVIGMVTWTGCTVDETDAFWQTVTNIIAGTEKWELIDADEYIKNLISSYQIPFRESKSGKPIYQKILWGTCADELSLELITDDYIFYGAGEGEIAMFNHDMELLSDNYFAENELFITREAVDEGKMAALYVSA